MKFTEDALEHAIIELLGNQGFPHTLGTTLDRNNHQEVLITADLHRYLSKRYASQDITPSEINTIIRQIETLPAGDLYESNKSFSKWLCDGFALKREDRSKKDLYICKSCIDSATW